MATAMGGMPSQPMVSQPISHGATALHHEPMRMEAPAPVAPPVVAQPHAEARVEPVLTAPAPAAVAHPASTVAPAAKADHFVAPPPVDAKTGARTQPTQRPNAMNEAALVNGGQAPAKSRRWTSILEIVASSSRRPARQAEPTITRGGAPSAPAVDSEASLPLLEPARPEPKGEQRAEAKLQQPELGGLEPPAPVASRAPGDDELLDIPAFLRRQAN
jgi:cell division protein FtsZ